MIARESHLIAFRCSVAIYQLSLLIRWNGAATFSGMLLAAKMERIANTRRIVLTILRNLQSGLDDLVISSFMYFRCPLGYI